MLNRTVRKGLYCHVGFVTALVLLLLAGTLNCYAGGSGMNSDDKSQPKWEDYATIESITNGVPVYSFSNIMYVYGQSPDLYPGVKMQEGNTNPAVKFIPKKSWEIKHNYGGAEHEMTRRDPRNDSQPLLPIHLIDGDPNTVWSTWGCHVPDALPEWIRIDLPMEAEVASVSLVCAPNFPWGNYGKALPKEVEILVSKDAWHWETVYENKEVPADGITSLNAKFKPVRAKQIWIKGGNFHRQVGLNQLFVFSIGEVEVKDTAGNNLALVSRGAGVTTSSTSHGYLNERHTQDALWNTLQYDLGLKWIRLGPDNGSFQWYQVEHERGKLQIDKAADDSITECAKNGVKVIMVLDFKGNWIYQNPPRKTNWTEARFREFTDMYNDLPNSVVSSPEMFEAYLKYVEYMVEHFKDRVTYFELGNEWNGGFYPDLVSNAPASEWFMTRFFERTYDTVKRVAPDAKIMLGSTGGYPKIRILECLGKEREYGIVDGKFAGSYQSRLVRDGVVLKDGTVSADALNIGAVYMLLRYQDEKNYLKASYNSAHKTVSFSEYVDGVAKPGSTLQEVSIPGSEVHMTAKLRNSVVTLTVSDGTQSVSLDHAISSDRLLRAGTVGLGQEQLDMGMWMSTDAGQRFDNFQVSDLSGKAIVKDTFKGQNGKVPAGWKYVYIDKNPIKKGWGAKVDAIGWHPWEDGPGLKYYNGVQAFKKECEALGFKGKCFATEIYAASVYPPGPAGGMMSEEQKAKYLTQSIVTHSALDMGAGPCHPHFTSYPMTEGFSRTTWATQIVTPVQPSMSYYMWRNISTVMDDFYPVEFPVKVKSDKEIVSLTFKRGTDESLVAAWLNGVMGDGLTESKTDITLPGMKAKKAWVVDIANGTEQELKISAQGGGTVIKGMLIKDYPVFIRVAQN